MSLACLISQTTRTTQQNQSTTAKQKKKILCDNSDRYIVRYIDREKEREILNSS